jgi:hypothetical protein
MKSLSEAFQEKFEENLKVSDRRKAAFEKTNEDMGFQAYSSYNSYLSSRKKRKKKR